MTSMEIRLRRRSRTNPSIGVFTTPLAEMFEEDVNDSISFFVLEVTRPNGKEYPTSSLHSLT